MMNTSILNLFKVLNLNELNFAYQLVKVDFPKSLESGTRGYKHWNQVLLELASQTQGPVASIYEGGIRYAAIKAYTPLKYTKVNLAPQSANISLVTDGIRQIQYAHIAAEELELATQFLYFYIREQLAAKKLWKYGSNEFYLQQPIIRPRSLDTEIYEGFTFRLKNIDNEFYIILDLAYKYTDRKFLNDRIAGRDQQQVEKELMNSRLLYFNGNSVYPVEFKGLGKPINTQKFRLTPEREISIYDYITTEGKYAGSNSPITLVANCPSLFHSYLNRSEIKSGATCFAKLVKSLKNEDTHSLHKETIHAPQTRFNLIKQLILNYFQEITFNGITLSVDPQPIELKLPVFKAPSLKYNNNVFNTSRVDSKQSNPLRDFGKLRKQLIYDHGIITQTYFGTNYLFIPESLGFQFAKSIKYHFDRNICAVAKEFEGLNIVMYDESDVASAYKQFRMISHLFDRRHIDEGAGLFVLPDHKHHSDRFLKDFHDCLKKAYYPNLRFQFASAKRLLKYFQPFCHKKYGWVYEINRSFAQEYKSYSSNLIFELLIINYKWLYALQKPLNYDIYIGIDAHDYYAGFCFFYRNGENIVFDYKRIIKGTGTFRNEKIDAELIADVLEENLKDHIPLYAPNPNGVIILRDGVSFGEEIVALQDVLKRAKIKDLFPDNVSWGVVDVKKQSSLALRVASKGQNQLENPWAGTYFLNKFEGFLFNTGYPFRTLGSSKPLYISLVAGENIDFNHVCEDIYYQSLLAFSAPDRPSSLPVSIKLIDTLIRSFAHRTDETYLENMVPVL